MSKPVRTDLDFGSVSKVLNLPAPVDAGDAANKAYVDSAIEGLSWKDSVRAATTANINLSSPGSAIDGVTLTNGDRVLVKDQSTTHENGIYIWNGAAVLMTRAADADTAASLEQAVVTVEEGTNANSNWRQSSVNFTLGSGAVTWASFGGASSPATETSSGVAELATLAEVNAGTDDARIVTPLKLASSNFVKKLYGTLFGDGVATSYTITHNLNSRDVIVAVYLNSGTYEEILCDVERTTVNSCTLKFSAAPTSNQYRVVVIG